MTTNNRARRVAILLVASAAVFVPVASATLSQTATFEEKVIHAEAIVVGKVLRQEARLDPSRRWILTYTTFRVERALKGMTGPEITIVTPGGELNGVHQSTIGVPQFDPGDENVVFVRDTPVGPTVLYLDQGAYEVAKDESGQRIVRPVPSDAVYVDTQRGLAITPEEPRTLPDFEAAVRAAERRGRVRQMAVLERDREARTPRESIWSDLADNLWIIALAVLGTILATIPFMKRSG